MTEPAPGTVPAEEVSLGPIKSLIQNEPVVVSYGVTWVFAQAGEFLLGHTHLINTVEWSTFTTSAVPIVTTAVLGGLAYVTRKYVSPIIKKIV